MYKFTEESAICIRFAGTEVNRERERESKSMDREKRFKFHYDFASFLCLSVSRSSSFFFILTDSHFRSFCRMALRQFRFLFLRLFLFLIIQFMYTQQTQNHINMKCLLYIYVSGMYVLYLVSLRYAYIHPIIRKELFSLFLSKKNTHLPRERKQTIYEKSLNK